MIIEADIMNSYEWLTQHGAFISKKVALHTDNAANRGIFAQSDIRQGSIIISVPRSCCIGHREAKSSIYYHALGHLSPEDLGLTVPAHCYMALFILEDMKNPNSRYRGIYDMLPTSFPQLPIFWSQDEVLYLEDSFLSQQIHDRKANLLRDYDAIISNLPQPSGITADEFLWARSIISTRNFGVMIQGRKDDLMVPFADMINHGRPPNCTWSYDEATAMFHVAIIMDIVCGDEFVMSYGSKSNGRLLLNYGFAELDNRSAATCESLEECRLLFCLSKDDSNLKEKEDLFGDAIALTSYDLANLSAARLSQLAAQCRISYPQSQLGDESKEEDNDSDDNDSKCALVYGRGVRLGLSIGAAAMDRCMSIARFIVSNDQELIHLPFIDDEYEHPSITTTSLDWELRALAFIRGIALEQLSRYHRSVDPELSISAKYSLIILDGEKEVCIFWVAFINLIVLIFHRDDKLSRPKRLVKLQSAIQDIYSPVSSKQTLSLTSIADQLSRVFRYEQELYRAGLDASFIQSSEAFLNSYPGAWLSDSDFYRKLYKCCSSVRFAERITLLRPFESVDQLFAACDRVWLVELDSNDWKESFKAHPRIGDKEELRKKLAGVKSMEGEEQAGAASASEEVLDALARGNDEYEQKFGFIFLICATGKSADEMLEALNKRMSNSIDDEVVISAKEQGKITRLRVTKLAQELIHSCAKL